MAQCVADFETKAYEPEIGSPFARITKHPQQIGLRLELSGQTYGEGIAEMKMPETISDDWHTKISHSQPEFLGTTCGWYPLRSAFPMLPPMGAPQMHSGGTHSVVIGETSEIRTVRQVNALCRKPCIRIACF